MTSPQPHIVVITASVRDGRIGHIITNWFIHHIDAPLTHDVIDLATPPTHPADTLAAADAFVIVTPEYNHSFPGPLKTFIDDNSPLWRYKPIAFASYGGVSGGLRAVAHLKTVFGELAAPPIRAGVVLHSPWRNIVDGELVLDRSAEIAAQATISELCDWARAMATLRSSMIASA